MQVGTKVTFQQNDKATRTGTVIRVWDKPTADVYVTILADGGSGQEKFTRCMSQVEEV